MEKIVNKTLAAKIKKQVEQAEKVIEDYRGKKLRVMEVCGTHTHEIFRQDIGRLVSSKINLIAGPGCPVCVTGGSFIDEARFLVDEVKAAVCTFGDLLRVPGSGGSLDDSRSRGGAVNIVYSPLDAVTYAREHPHQQVVFLSVGFETTVPSACLAVKQAAAIGLKNFSLLTANKTMDEAYKSLATAVDAYLYPGHVCAITGTNKLAEMANPPAEGGMGISGAVAGFKAEEIMLALATIVKKSAAGEPFFVNCYPRVVRPEGNIAAQKLIAEYMEPCDSIWRGLGNLPGSGLKLRAEFAAFDAAEKFSLPSFVEKMPPGCRCGEILQGAIEPPKCKLFGNVCTPLRPVGACMVSSEGTCAAYYKFAREGQ